MRSALQELTEVRYAQYVMGTLVEITADANDRDQDSTLRALQEGMQEFENLERIFSRFDPASELSRVNRLAATGRCRVSSLFFEVVERGISYSRLSGGTFSIALGPLVSLWNCSAQRGCWPDKEKVKRAWKLADPRLVELDSRRGTIRFGLPGMSLNLDGFVKGIATDSAREVLQRNGIRRAVINAGTSSFSAYGFGDAACRVGLSHPSGNGQMVAVCRLGDASLSSSGTGEQSYTLCNRQLSHLIDPRSGYPLEAIESATSVTPSAAVAEAASKMLLFLGNSKAHQLFETADWNVEGIRLASTADGRELRFEYGLSTGMEVEILA